MHVSKAVVSVCLAAGLAGAVRIAEAQAKSAPRAKFVLSSSDARLATKVPEEYTANLFGCSGVFPHEKIADDKITLYVHPKNPNRMRTLDENGRKRHWILEIHFVDRALRIGGFYEELLTI